MAMEDTVKIYDEIQTDLDAAFPLVTRSVSVDLVEAGVLNRSVEGKCWQTLQKKYDVYKKKINAELNSKTEKLQKEIDQKNKVG